MLKPEEIGARMEHLRCEMAVRRRHRARVENNIICRLQEDMLYGVGLPLDWSKHEALQKRDEEEVNKLRDQSVNGRDWLEVTLEELGETTWI